MTRQMHYPVKAHHALYQARSEGHMTDSHLGVKVWFIPEENRYDIDAEGSATTMPYCGRGLSALEAVTFLRQHQTERFGQTYTITFDQTDDSKRGWHTRTLTFNADDMHDALLHLDHLLEQEGAMLIRVRSTQVQQ